MNVITEALTLVAKYWPLVSTTIDAVENKGVNEKELLKSIEAAMVAASDAAMKEEL